MTSSPAPHLVDRKPGWRLALYAALDERRGLPFAWGTNDGAIFAADMVKVMTGVDLAAPFRGRYRSEAGARRVMKAAGYADLTSLVADRLAERRRGRATTGDVALIVVERPGHKPSPCLGIVDRALIKVLTAEGVGTLPLGDAKRVFEV